MRKGIKGMGGTVEEVGWDREGRERRNFVTCIKLIRL